MIRTGWLRTTGDDRNVAGTARRTRNLTARVSVRHSGKGRGVEPCHPPVTPTRAEAAAAMPPVV